MSLDSTNHGNTITLLADIGGTNCRFVLQAGDQLLGRETLSTGAFDSPEAAITHFLASFHGARPRSAAIAVAGPVNSEIVHLTNIAWVFDRARIRAACGIDNLILVNDLVAQAHGVTTLSGSQFAAIGSGSRESSACTVVVGPGTGFGIARIDNQRRVSPSEGGHVGFAPYDDVEHELCRMLRRELGHITNETLISGPGLTRIYRMLGILNGHGFDFIDGPEIIRRAIAGSDDFCSEAVRRFSLMLASASGDAALAACADRIVFVGSIVNALAPILSHFDFRQRFEDRGPKNDFLKSTATFVAAEPELGIVGASKLLKDLSKTAIPKSQGC